MEKLVFQYKWLDDYDKLSHVGPVEYKNFYSKLRGGSRITPEEYTEFVREFHSRGCVTMINCIRVYNEADVIPFIQALDKIQNQYCPDEINMLKDAVSIPGISMTYMLNKVLKLKKPGDPYLYATGQPCEYNAMKNVLE